MKHYRLIAVVALLLAGTGLRADEAEAEKALKKVGANIIHKEFKPDGPVMQVFLNVTRATDADLKHLREFKELDTLGLAASKITDAGLKELKDMKGLISLELSQTNVTDAGLKELYGLTNLSRVSLKLTKVTDAGVRDLQKALPGCKIER